MSSSADHRTAADVGGSGLEGDFDPEEAIDRQRVDRQRHDRRELIIQQLLRAAVVVAFFAAWQFFARRSTPLVLPEPLDVWNETWKERDLVLEEGWTTIRTAVIGALYGCGLGFGFGVLIAHSRRADAVLNPFIVASQSIPKVALAPLFVVWFGFGSAPKVAIAALISFFPLLENTVVGLRRVDPSYLKLFRSVGASGGQVFWRLRLVNAAPYILTGLRISLLYALLGTIVGEFIAGNKGLGAQIVNAQGLFRTQLMFGLIAALTVLGLVLYAVVRAMERLLLARLHLGSGSVGSEATF
jgi:NitT/TauT family transport system permease protein